jgi:hypothetical protein
VEFSNRNVDKAVKWRGTQDGQAVVEYILVLIVTVGLVLGGVYQLNSAFKAWAKEYYGDYLACLLETGDLPLIDGGTGDSGICNQLFKAFSLADGRPLATAGGTTFSPVNPGGANTSPAQEGPRGGGFGGGSGSGMREGAGGSGSGTNSLNNSWARSSAGKSGNGKSGSGSGSGNSASDTGDTSVSKFGNIRTNSKAAEKKERLDTHFAFDTDREPKQDRVLASTRKSPPPEGQSAGKLIVHAKRIKADSSSGGDDSSMSFGNLLRYLIIAIIVIALAVFFGGQILQISNADDA